jgi:hypothetical protein
MTANEIYNILGVAGASMVLFGFYRTNIGRWSYKSPLYELDNLIGSLLIMMYQFHMHSYISIVLNIVWATVAFIGFSKFARRHYKYYLAKNRS